MKENSFTRYHPASFSSPPLLNSVLYSYLTSATISSEGKCDVNIHREIPAKRFRKWKNFSSTSSRCLYIFLLSLGEIKAMKRVLKKGAKYDRKTIKKVLLNF